MIIGFSRKCLEIKALNEQECIHSEMAVCAFVRSLLRCRSLPVETETGALLPLTETAIHDSTRGLRPELLKLYYLAWRHAMDDERRYLPIIRQRITEGSLAELMRDRFEKDGEIVPIMAACLQKNQPYVVR